MIKKLVYFLPILVFIIPGISSSKASARPADENGARPTHQKMLEKYDADGDGTLSAQEKETFREAMRSRRGSNNPERRQAILERFDTDGDGVLSDDEKQAFRQGKGRKGKKRNRNTDGSSMRRKKHDNPEARQKRLERFDADGDGVLSDDEKSAARDAMKKQGAEKRQRLLERFDADGDGQLSDEEREAAHQARKERRDSNR